MAVIKYTTITHFEEYGEQHHSRQQNEMPFFTMETISLKIVKYFK